MDLEGAVVKREKEVEVASKAHPVLQVVLDLVEVLVKKDKKVRQVHLALQDRQVAHVIVQVMRLDATIIPDVWLSFAKLTVYTFRYIWVIMKHHFIVLQGSLDSPPDMEMYSPPMNYHV